MEIREGVCVCGQTFEIPIKRGRPPVRCPECRDAYANGTLPDRLASLGVDRSVLGRRPFNSSPTPTPKGEIKNPQCGSEIENMSDTDRVNDRLNRLEGALKERGLHISQHRDKW